MGGREEAKEQRGNKKERIDLKLERDTQTNQILLVVPQATA
jgi:hypothetical protein